MAETAGLERGMDQSTAKQQAGSPPLALLELSQLPRRRRPRRRRPCARRTRRRQSHWRRSGRRRVLGFGARRLKAEQVPGLSAVDTSAGENTRDGPVEGRRGGGKTVRHAEEGGQDVMWHATGGAGGGTRGGAHLGRRYPPALLPPREGEALRPGRHCLPPAPPPRDARTCAPLLGPEKTIKDAAELPCLPPPPLSRGACLAACGVRGARGRSLRPSPPRHARPCRQRAAGTVVRPPTSTTPRGEGGGASSRLAQGSAPLTRGNRKKEGGGDNSVLGAAGAGPQIGAGSGGTGLNGRPPGAGRNSARTRGWRVGMRARVWE